MKVNQMIASLTKYNQEARVFIWLDGVRYPIDTDCPFDAWEDDAIVDINASIVDAT